MLKSLKKPMQFFKPLERTWKPSNLIGASDVVIDALAEAAERFYAKYDFHPLNIQTGYFCR